MQPENNTILKADGLLYWNHNFLTVSKNSKFIGWSCKLWNRLSKSSGTRGLVYKQKHWQKLWNGYVVWAYVSETQFWHAVACLEICPLCKSTPSHNFLSPRVHSNIENWIIVYTRFPNFKKNTTGSKLKQWSKLKLWTFYENSNRAPVTRTPR